MIDVLGNLCGTCVVDRTTCSNPCANGGDRDAFALKFFATGDRLLGATFGGPGDQRALAAAIDGSGYIYVAGDYAQSMTIGGTPLPVAGAVDPFLAKFTNVGGYRWAVGLGAANRETETQSATAVTVDNSGNVFVAGNFDGNVFPQPNTVMSNGDDVFVAKYTANGIYAWGNRFGSDSLADSVTDIVAGQDGNVFIAGSTGGTIQFNAGPVPPIGIVDMFTARLAGDTGAPRFDHRWGSAMGFAYEPRIAIFPGGIYLAGTFGGTATFNFNGLMVTPNSDAQPDVLFLKLYP